MDKILVTGAGGFVGKALCKMLQDRGIPFVGAVRNGAGVNQCAVGEMTGATDWSAALAGCSAVIHLAARVHVMRDTAQDPLAAYRSTNVDATLNLARQSIRAGAKRFVFVSSVKVNGENTREKPFTPFDSASPQDPYGRSKFEAEQALREFAQQSGLEVVIVRPPLVYGPGVKANFLRLMQLVKMGIPLPLGRIGNRRSMVALDNLVDLLVVCAGHPKAAGQTFMVSDDHDVSITELIRLIGAAMGKRPILMPVPAGLISGAAGLLGKADLADRIVGSLQVDIGHTRSTLDWEPKTSTAKAVQDTVSDFLAAEE